MAEKVIHKIGFRVKDKVVASVITPAASLFSFDSTTHFFNESNWNFSDDI